MKFKYTIQALLLLSVLLINKSVKAQQEKAIILHLNAMFQQKSVAPVKDDLAANFSVGAYMLPSAENMLKTITDRYACDSVTYKSTETVSGKTQVTAVFHLKNKPAIESGIYLDEQQKILYVDAFDKLYGMNRYQKSRLRASIPFELENGSIILRLKLNDSQRPLRMLFDTGADGMAMTQALADSIGIKASRKQNTSVVGGNMEISVSEGNDVHLDTFTFANQNIALFKEMHKGADGIIGNAIAKRFIVKVDFDAKRLSLYDFGDYQYEKAGASVPVTMPSGLFIIPGILSVTEGLSNTGEFVFDTGASYDLICFRPFVKKNRLLVNGFKPESVGSTTSMGMSTPTFSGKAASFSFAQLPAIKNMPVTLMSGGGQNENWNPGFDGSIGIRLISRYNFTINMQKKEIHFTPVTNYNSSK